MQRAEALIRIDPSSADALALLDDFLRREPTSALAARAWLRAGELHERRGELTAAWASYALAEQPQAETWVRRWALLRGARLDLDFSVARTRARGRIEQVLAEGRTDAAAAWALLSLGEEQRMPDGNPAKAAAAFEEAAKLGADPQVAAWSQAHLGDLSSTPGPDAPASVAGRSPAIGAATAGANAEDARVWHLLESGDRLAARGQRDAALRAYQQASLARASRNPWCWARLKTGETLLVSGRADAGRTALTEVVEGCDDPSASSYAHLGLARDDLCRRRDHAAYEAHRAGIRAAPARAAFFALGSSERCRDTTPGRAP